MTASHVLFVANAGPEVGGGHVMRSLTLARALEAKGASFTFVAPPAVQDVLGPFAPEVQRIGAASTAPRDLGAAVAGGIFDAIVFDHYGLSAKDQAFMRQGRPAMAIEDLADRALDVDLILDSSPARKASDYDGLAPTGVRLLLGPRYAPVRPEFAALRDTALGWRGEPVQRVLVSLGLTDVGGITSRVVDRLRLKAGTLGLDIVLGAAAPSLPGLAKIARRDLRLLLHVDTPHMARLTAEADLAIGASGSSVWERCTLGLPSILVVVADNQRRLATYLAEHHAALVVDAAAADFENQFDLALRRVLSDTTLRRSLTQASSELCDGEGAPRAAEAFLATIAERTGAQQS